MSGTLRVIVATFGIAMIVAGVGQIAEVFFGSPLWMRMLLSGVSMVCGACAIVLSVQAYRAFTLGQKRSTLED